MASARSGVMGRGSFVACAEAVMPAAPTMLAFSKSLRSTGAVLVLTGHAPERIQVHMDSQRVARNSSSSDEAAQQVTLPHQQSSQQHGRKEDVASRARVLRKSVE